MQLLRRFRAVVSGLFSRVTPLGRAVLFIGLVTWCVAIAFGWREFAVVAGACLVAFVVAWVFTFGRTNLAIDLRLSPSRVVAGETSFAEFAVTNASSRRMLPVRLEVPIAHAVQTIQVPSLGGGDTFEEFAQIQTVRRSVVLVGPTKSVRGDPLGLMRREMTWADAHELFVHPKTHRLQGLSSGWLRDLEGRPTNDRSPSDVAFHTLREYVPGDDRRHVHWRTSARLGKLMVRQFVDTRRSHLGVVIDTNPGNYASEDEFELGISMGISLALRAISDGQDASCVGGGRRISTHTGQALLDGVARIELGVPTIGVGETAAHAAPLLKDASVIAFVTGSATSMAQLAVAGQRFAMDSLFMVLRADFDASPAVQRTPHMMTITANELDGFAGVVRAVAGQ